MEGMEDKRLEREGVDRGEDSGDETISPDMCLRGLEKIDMRVLLDEVGNGLIDVFLPSWFCNSRSSAMSFSIMRSLSCSLNGFR